MSKLTWLETFSLDVPEIDGDHRVMLELMKLLESAAEVPDRDRCEKYLDRLLAFARHHFLREEALLESWGIPNVAIHARYHRDLIEQADGVKEACMNVDRNDAAFQECCNEMIAFLVDDVVRGDLKLKSSLNDAGIALRV